jgi:hypothetical protein
MRWHAQVLHVARKDLRLSRWLLLAYAAVVAAAGAAAAEWGVFAAIAPALRMLGVVMLGAVLLAVLVQADSPARGDSLWVTLPLRSSAVFAAKILVGVVVVIGIALLGQLAGLRAHDVAPGDLAALLGRSALSYGAWLAVVAAVASLTRDLRGFLLALTLAGFAWLFAVQVIVFGIGPSVPSGWSTWPFFIAGMLLLLAHQYHTRDVRRGAAIAVAVAIALMFLPMALPRSAASATPASRPIPVHLRPGSIEIGELALKAGSQTGFTIRLTGASPFHQYLLVSPTVRMRMAGGSFAAVRVKEPLVSINEPIPRLNGLRNLGERLRMTRVAGGVSLDLSPAQRQALAAGQAKLSLRGQLEVREVRAGAEMPLRVGASSANGGSRIRITNVETLPEGPEVELRTSTVSPPGDRQAETTFESRVPRYLLVNRGRGEALELRFSGSSGSDFSLVLPGPRAQSSTTDLVANFQQPGEAPRIEPAWLGAARLQFVSWVAVGSDPIAVEERGRGYKEWYAEDAARGRGR